MKIIVASDSHGRRDRLRAVLSLHADADAFLFLGDGLRDLPDATEGLHIGKTEAVRGNCDSFSFSSAFDTFPEECSLTLGGVHMLMMHGHTHGVKGGIDRAVRYAVLRGADLLLYGHTHIPEETYLPAGSMLSDGFVLPRPIYVMNPGSIGEPRQGAPSYGILTCRNGQILLSHGTL